MSKKAYVFPGQAAQFVGAIHGRSIGSMTPWARREPELKFSQQDGSDTCERIRL